MIVRLAAEAERDLEAIGDWIAADIPVRALSFVEELRAACLGLHHPRPARRRGLRASAWAGVIWLGWPAAAAGIRSDRVLAPACLMRIEEYPRSQPERVEGLT